MDARMVNFLNSSKDEAEFFGVSKENAITLEEYHDWLRSIDGSFRYNANTEVSFMKRKLDWLDEVAFEGFQLSDTNEWSHTSIRLFAKDGEELWAKFNPDTGKYEGGLQNVPKIYLISKRIRTNLKRQEDIEQVQRELQEIEKIAREIYDGKLEFRKTISSKFEITYRPNAVMDVWYDPEYEHNLIASYYEPNKRKIDIPYLSESSNRKLGRKLYLKK